MVYIYACVCEYRKKYRNKKILRNLLFFKRIMEKIKYWCMHWKHTDLTVVSWDELYIVTLVTVVIVGPRVKLITAANILQLFSLEEALIHSANWQELICVPARLAAACGNGFVSLQTPNWWFCFDATPYNNRRRATCVQHIAAISATTSLVGTQCLIPCR